MGKQNQQLSQTTVISCLISEAILNDKELQQFKSERTRIYSLAIPKIILGKDGKAETIWVDERNNPNLKKIDELIKHRIEQIKKHFINSL